MTTNAVDSLLSRIDDDDLRDSLQREVDRLRDTKDLGLVFERHLPERVRLLSYPIKRGVEVQDRRSESEETWVVASVKSGVATLVGEDGSETKRTTDELVVIRGFGDPIYPGLTSLGKLKRGGDKPFHAVIKGENFYVLETLLYAHEGQVDCIYIDPPYNSGAKDWKYNNDYVDSEDAYRHSKWLSFMEKRLYLAKRLLNPEQSILIVTIDEKEYLRLGLLLEQVFTGCLIEMVTSVISAKGVVRVGQFSRVEEYLFIVHLGDAPVEPVSRNMLDVKEPVAEGSESVQWLGLRRREPSAKREARPNQFYPVFVKVKDGSLHSIGAPLADGIDRTTVACPKGTVPQWPLTPSGDERLWGLTPETARAYAEKGFLRVRSWNPSKGTVAVQYLPGGTVAAIESGEVETLGYEADGSVIAQLSTSTKTTPPKRVWHMPSHNAETGGTNLISKLLPGRRFPYPKSLYAAEDVLRFFVADKPDALIIDFFGGSGTTAHAVARLNRQYPGRRRSIVVTNNEVSDDEAKALREAGHYPGQPEWEALGIFEHITRPRVTAAVTGKTPDGSPVAGDYKFVDEYPMSDGLKENVEFFELAYLDKDTVARGKAFEAIAPVLWLRFGAGGSVIGKQVKGYAAPASAKYAVLFDINKWQGFVEAIRERSDLASVCIVTDSTAQFQQVVAELPEGVAATMLYEDYLRNFEINTGMTS